MLGTKLGRRTAVTVLTAACFTLGLSADAVPDRKPFVPQVEPTIQGKWRQVYVEFDGVEQNAEYPTQNRWVITDQTITIWILGPNGHRDSGSWRYTLNAKTTPAELDLTVLGAKNQTYPSILQLEGDRLTVCLQNYPERGRPQDFISRKGSGIGKFIYMRMPASD